MVNSEILKQIPFTAWIFLLLCLITLVDVFSQSVLLAEISSGLIFLFVVLEFNKIPKPQQIAGTLLIALALISALSSNEWQAVIVDGVGRSRIFLLLFFAISWLQLPAGESKSLGALRDYMVSQKPAKRFLYLAFGVHALGSVLNIAGLSLMTNAVEKEQNQKLKRRLSVTLMLGFGSVSCWSPFFIGMVVVLIALPGLNWMDLAPTGLAMAFVIIIAGWTFDRMIYARSATAEEIPRSTLVSGYELAGSILIFLSLVGSTMIVVEVMGASVPVALAIVGPPFSLIWFAIQNQTKKNVWGRGNYLVKQVIGHLPSFRNESLVFAAANMFGVGIATVLPRDELSRAFNFFVPWADAKLLLLIACFLACSAVGLHPVIVVISISTIFPPSAIGISDWIIALTFLGSWGLSTSISPFSGTTLFMSRVTGKPAHIIGWSWTPPMIIVGASMVGMTVILLRHLTSY